MERSKSHLSMPEVKENNYDFNKNRIINLKNFQLKKILKSDIENKKSIEIKLNELMDNKIKYKKNKISNKLYVVKAKKILHNKIKLTPYQLYEKIKNEILSKSILKNNNTIKNYNKFHLINHMSDTSDRNIFKHKKITIKKKGMISGTKYLSFSSIKKSKAKKHIIKFNDFSVIKVPNNKINNYSKSYYLSNNDKINIIIRNKSDCYINKNFIKDNDFSLAGNNKENCYFSNNQKLDEIKKYNIKNKNSNINNSIINNNTLNNSMLSTKSIIPRILPKLGLIYKPNMNFYSSVNNNIFNVSNNKKKNSFLSIFDKEEGYI